MTRCAVPYEHGHRLRGNACRGPLRERTAELWARHHDLRRILLDIVAAVRMAMGPGSAILWLFEVLALRFGGPESGVPPLKGSEDAQVHTPRPLKVPQRGQGAFETLSWTRFLDCVVTEMGT